MPKTPLEEEEVKGSVIDKEKKNPQRVGGSHMVVIPAHWFRKYFNTTVLELKLVSDESVWGRWVIVITKPSKKEERR